MNALADLRDQLAALVEDGRLTTEEKHTLHGLAVEQTPESLRYLRNRAFDIAREQCEPGSAMQTLKWLQQIVKVIDLSLDHHHVSSEALFSPGDDCRNKIKELLHRAQHQVDICVYTISDDAISDKIIETFNRGVNIRIITDNQKTDDQGSDIDNLAQQCLAVVEDNSPHHMHHKFALFDGAILVNGSFNWTRSASQNNEENIVVTNDQTLVTQFQQKFDALWHIYNEGAN